ncbi:c-type cytochrome [Pontibacter sp. SGAir0037]|uniref:c-type cytochrome n=1 Tax=Pontibacter sp. SGAir0037 TaxID=2571030 RepID=UPI0010CD01EA|nr:c-type cytochrome [Pontibacter sp. SGAir0037]QCR22027.1 cytochrome c class I [Pontibacter sp. SGAir0037]
MKKIMLAASCVAFMVACGGNSNSEYDQYYSDDKAASEATTDDNMTAATRQSEVDTNATNIGTDRTETAATAAQGNFEKGAKLIEMSDCLACHKVDQKLVGPSYEDVANKYEFNDKNVDYLSQKIVKGGSGVWGQVPMSPHPDLSADDAKEMARYVLSLRKK